MENGGNSPLCYLFLVFDNHDLLRTIIQRTIGTTTACSVFFAASAHTSIPTINGDKTLRASIKLVRWLFMAVVANGV